MISLEHLQRLMGPHGLFEHARYRQPRVEHGYCTDDNARALVITAGLDTPAAHEVFRVCLDFVKRGRAPGGWRNRMSEAGRWLDEHGPDDSHGRVVWGLGEALRHGRLPQASFPLFEEAALRPLRFLRSTVYAVLGATAAHDSPLRAAARRALDLHCRSLPRARSGEWPWPEPRLTYDNARLPQAMIVAGEVAGERSLLSEGLDLLDWLVRVESGRNGFSFTPVGGRGPGERGPAFDQQPIEAWAMADACAAAARVTGDAEWFARAERAVDWFRGANDTGAVLFDPASGAGHDGLTPTGVNGNCGAESTLSALGAEIVREGLAGRRFRTAAS